ncbi:MAG: hypothetical protein ACI85V_000643 [bacterium]|jgi:hypothetical protein
MKICTTWLLSAIATLPATAHAATVLSVDLSIINQVTITAEAGFSAVSASGSGFIGIYLDQFYGGAGSPLDYALVSGDLTNANNPARNTPQLYRDSPTDTGLNIWAFSSDNTVDFTAGSLAFTGSATWTLSELSYGDMLAGATGGSVFFPADSFESIGGATSIGEWGVAAVAPIPLPGSALLFGSALLGFGIYGRRKKAAICSVTTS